MIVRAPASMQVPPDSWPKQDERVVGIPEREFGPRAKSVIVVTATAIGATKCAGPRFRVEQIMLPAVVGYRFAIGLVVDGNPKQHKIAKTFPIHGASLSEVSIAMPLHLYVKEQLEIYVRRYTIKPSYRFLGDTPYKFDHLGRRKDRELLSINTTRPDVKEPPLVTFVGSVRLLLAPPDGWN
jgi:hypothetical protein